MHMVKQVFFSGIQRGCGVKSEISDLTDLLGVRFVVFNPPVIYEIF